MLRTYETLKQYLSQGYPTPMGYILGHWTNLAAVARDNFQVPKFLFTDDTHLSFTYEGIPYDVPGFRRMLKSHIEDCAKILHNDLLLGIPWESYSSVIGPKFDDPSNHQVGHSFIKDQRNPISRHRSLLMTLTLSSHILGVRHYFGHVVHDRFVWNPLSCRKWLDRAQEFLGFLSVVMQFVQGQPARGTEFLTTSISNMRNCPRTLFFHKAQLVNALRANKRESMSGQAQAIPRFCPENVSLLLDIYLCLIRPVEIEVAAAILSPKIVHYYSNYLFTGPDGRWQADKLTHWLKCSIKEKLGPHCSVGLSDLRQILIFLFHAHCGYADRLEEHKTDEEREWDELGDLQAGHSSAVAHSHYAIEERSLESLQQRKWRGLHSVSIPSFLKAGLQSNAICSTQMLFIASGI
jgi:hypothetical protein